MRRAAEALHSCLEMKTILVATDGSPNGEAAVDAGVELAAGEGATVVLVHVVSAIDFVERGNGSASARPQRLPTADDDPTLQAGLAAAIDHGVVAKAELLVGYPPKQIARLGAEIGADLIVVGSRGLSRMRSVVFGSTSRELVAHAGRPVLVVQPVPAAVAARATSPGAR